MDVVLINKELYNFVTPASCTCAVICILSVTDIALLEGYYGVIKDNHDGNGNGNVPKQKI